MKLSKKFLLISAITALAVSPLVSTTTAMALEQEVAPSVPETETPEVSPETPETPVEKLGNVIITNTKGGEIVTDIDEGKVGDLVTVYVKPYVLYKIESVTVNGVAIVPGEDNMYTFLLVEGANNISATYVVDNKELETFAGVLADAKNGDWENIFNLENMLTVIGWIISTIFSAGFFVTLIKMRKIKNITSKEIEENVGNMISTTLGGTINSFLENAIKPVLEEYNGRSQYLEEICKLLARCFALAQENTPESRLAIINELTRFNNSEKDLNEEVMAVINTEIEKNNADKEQLNKDIAELKAENEKVVAKQNTPKKEDDGYGQM